MTAFGMADFSECPSEWRADTRRVYQRKIYTIDELKQRLIEVWCGHEQSTVNMAIDQWRKT